MIEIQNRKAKFDYEIIDTYEAGIVLTGTEVKSIRAGKAQLENFYYIKMKYLDYVINLRYKDFHLYL